MLLAILTVESGVLIGVAAIAVTLGGRWISNMLNEKKESITNGLLIKELRREHDKLEKRVENLEQELRHKE